jgi:hypothetical protein
MKRIKIRDLPDWPPLPGGTDSNSPASNQVNLTTVSPKLVDGLVTFVGEFERQPLTYDYMASSEELAEAFRKALRNNLGTSVFGLGDVELETGERSAA